MHETEPTAPGIHLHPMAITAGLLAISLIGLLVRLYGLTDYGLWFDEAYHIELVKLPTVWSMLDAVLSNPPSDPLYVLLLRPWTALFGTDAASVRSFSVIFGTATIPATFFLGKHSLGTAAGLGGALFFALSPYAIELGQEAALYALAALLTTLTIAAGWRFLHTGRGTTAYVLVGVLAIYSHYVVAVILLLFAAAMLLFHIRDRGTGKRWIVLNGLILLSWLPWLIALLAHWLGSDLPRASIQHPATIQEIAGGLIQFTSGTASLQQGERWLQRAGLVIAPVLLLLSCWLSTSKKKKALAVMVGLFTVIYIAPALVSSVNGMWLFVPHFMLFLLPLLFVCFAGFLVAIRPLQPAIIRLVGFLAIGGWLVVQGWGIVLYNQYPPHGKDGLRELAAVINSENMSGQEVFVTPPALMPMLAQYYSGELTGLPEDFDLRRVYIPFDAADWYARSMNTIQDMVKSGDTFWLVYRPELDEGGRLLAELRLRYTLGSERHYSFSDLYLFTAAP